MYCIPIPRNPPKQRGEFVTCQVGSDQFSSGKLSPSSSSNYTGSRRSVSHRSIDCSKSLQVGPWWRLEATSLYGSQPIPKRTTKEPRRNMIRPISESCGLTRWHCYLNDPSPSRTMWCSSPALGPIISVHSLHSWVSAFSGLLFSDYNPCNVKTNPFSFPSNKPPPPFLL